MSARHRRHLTAPQRAAIAAELSALSKHGGDRGDRGKRSTDLLPNGSSADPLMSIDEAAAALGVGTASVGRARKVLRWADAETIAQVQSGTLPIRAAARLADIPAAVFERYLATAQAA